MALDGNFLDDSFNVKVRDSFNTTNTTNLGVDLDNVGNVDESTNDSGNLDVDIDDSGNSDSHDVTVGISDSWNTDNSVNDDSINAGNREYNTGTDVGGAAAAAAGGGGGDTWIDARSTVVDQSINANIIGGAVGIGSFNEANVASGDGSVAVGGDFTVADIHDASTNIAALGDVNIGNTTNIDVTAFSNNSYVDESSTTVDVFDVDVDGSFNDGSIDVSATDSFNADLSTTTESTWDVDANVIWGSEDSLIVDDITVDADLPDV